MFKLTLFASWCRHGRASSSLNRLAIAFIGLLILPPTTGCYVPLHSPAIQATRLPDTYRMPARGVAGELNLASLTVPSSVDYVVGPNDTLEVIIAGLSNPGVDEQVRPIRATIMANGKLRLPLVGEVYVGGMNLSDAQKAIDDAYSDGVLVNPKTSVSLAEAAMLGVPVMGEVASPGVYNLRKHENDLAHAIALAGGLTEYAADVIEVHRRVSEQYLVRRLSALPADGEPLPYPPEFTGQRFDGEVVTSGELKIVIQIPLRGGMPAIVVDGQKFLQEELPLEDIALRPGDVIVIPRQSDEVFFVVGLLNRNNTVNFRVSDLDRRLGNAFLLPRDRDVDVVTAVAMAGYIHPIDSPSTVTVHRSLPGAPPMLINVDLIAARYDWNENVYVQPGDIIYLNPDAAWWWRRTFDRIVPDLITIPYAEGMFRWINPRRININ